MTTLDETKNRSIEGFGIAYIEAGFFGIPSIASNIGGTPEAVINEHTGIIINNFESIYESIKNLLQDKKKLYFLGKNAQKKSIELYNWEYTTKRYKQTFEEIDNLKIL